MFGQISDKSNRARAFSYFSFAGNLGLFLGPLLGGLTSEPAVHMPNTLGRIHLFRQYPFALPCLLASLYVAVCFVVSLVYRIHL